MDEETRNRLINGTWNNEEKQVQIITKDGNAGTVFTIGTAVEILQYSVPDSEYDYLVLGYSKHHKTNIQQYVKKEWITKG